MIKINSPYYLLFVLFLFGIYTALIFNQITDLNLNFLFMAFQFASIVYAFYLQSVKTQIQTILAMSFLGIDYVLLLLPLVLLPKLIWGHKKIYRKELSHSFWYVLIFLLYGLVLSIPTSFLHFSPLNNIFWLFTFGSGMGIYLYYSRFKFSKQDISGIFDFFRQLIVLQLVLVVIQSGINGTFNPGDWGQGSFKDAHKTGFFILLLFLFHNLAALFHKKRSIIQLFTGKRVLGNIVLLLALLMVDAKIVYLFFLLAIGLFVLLLLLYKVFVKESLFSIKKIVFIGSLLMLVAFNLPAMFDFYVQEVLDNNESFEMYVDEYADGEKSPSYKAKFFERVFVDMQDDYLTWTFGVGAGKLGSRASNSLAFDVLHKDGQKLPDFIEPHSSPWVKSLMGDLWTQRVALEMRNVSSTMVNPFTGIASIKGELGLVGLILFLLAMINIGMDVLRTSRKVKKPQLQTWALVLALCWLAMPLLMIIDTYMEKPQIMIPLFLLSALLINSSSDEDSEFKSADTYFNSLWDGSEKDR